jgi:hypothetical protein
MPSHATDTVLVRCTLATSAGVADAARRFCATAGWPLVLQRAAATPGGGPAYVYARLQGAAAMPDSTPDLFARQWQELCPQAGGIDVSRLRLALDLAGHSSGSQPRQHYVVETDPETGWDEEIARWYRDEHMPGLAAVPGCILAQRYDNLDGGPRSLACYDLVTADTLGSPPWLAVRHTEWSSRTRPHFTNTRRTMMDVVA